MAATRATLGLPELFGIAPGIEEVSLAYRSMINGIASVARSAIGRGGAKEGGEFSTVLLRYGNRALMAILLNSKAQVQYGSIKSQFRRFMPFCKKIIEKASLVFGADCFFTLQVYKLNHNL